MDGTDVWLEEGVGAGVRRGWGLAVGRGKAGNAGFRIESYGIFVSKILGTFHICSSCFGLNGPLRQYFSLYRAVSQREGERTDRREKKCPNNPHPHLLQAQ